MSHPDDERNPWKSLADLLSNKMDVATLATAIEEKGIYTWDRFGRMIEATNGDANDLYSQARVLDLLALVYKNAVDAQNDIDSGVGHDARRDLDGFIEDFDGPLVRFGWPSDECPDFATYKPEHSVPKAISQAGPPDEEGLILTRERKSLEAIIRVLMKEAKMPTEPYKAAKIIADLTSDENGTCEVSQYCVADHLKRIQHKTDAR
jgi:hypothetical protein